MRKSFALFAILTALLFAALSPVAARAQAGYFLGAGPSYVFIPGWQSGDPTPSAITVDGNGNIFVAAQRSPGTTSQNGGVYELVANNGNFYIQYYALPNTNNYPNAIATDNSGNVYVTDSNNKAVIELTAASGFSTALALGSGWVAPYSIAVDRAGDVYVQDGATIKMLKAVNGSIPASPTVYTLVTSSDSVYFGNDQSAYVSVDASGNVFFEAVQSGYSYVFYLKERGSLGANQYNSPQPVAALPVHSQPFLIDAQHEIFYQYHNAILKLPNVSLAGANPFLPNPLNASGYFSNLSAFSLDNSGNLWALDSYNPGYAYQLLPGGTNFGSANVGATSSITVPLNFYIASQTHPIDHVSVLTDGVSGLDFADAGSGTCVPGVTFSGYASCFVNVSFTPTQAGARNGSVVIYDTTGSVVATAYVQGTGEGTVTAYTPGTQSTIVTGLNAPEGIAVGGDGSLYIANSGTNQLLKETASGGSYTQSAIGSGFQSTAGVAVDPANNLYVYVSDPTGKNVYQESLVGGSYQQKALLNCCPGAYSALAADGSGDVYSIWSTGTSGAFGYGQIVTKQDPYFSGQTGQTVVSPTGIAADSSDNFYVTDSGGQAVYKFAPNTASSYFSSSAIGSGWLQPTAITVDGQGNLYVADAGLNEIIKESPASGGGYTQSVVQATGLGTVGGLAVDQQGNLYISDYANGNIVELNFNQPPSPPELSIVAWHSSPIYQGGQGRIEFTVANRGGATLGTATVIDTLDPNFTFDSASSGCSVTGQTVACGIPPGLKDYASFYVIVTASSNAPASLSNVAVLTDSTDAILPGSDEHSTDSNIDNIPISPTQPFGNLELAVDAATASSTVQRADSLFVSGWVADPVDGAPLGNAHVFIDGTDAGKPLLGLARPDVASANSNTDYTDSGYQFVTPAAALSTGRHAVTVVATDSIGRSTTFGPLSFTVAAGPPVGNLEQAVDGSLGGSTVYSADSVFISGWAADPTDGAPLGNVKVSIDGTIVGTPTLNIARPDVASYFSKPAYANSGFQFSYAASGLTVGAHSVTVTATDSGGLATSFGPLTFTVSAATPPAPPFGTLELAVDARTASTTVSRADYLWVSGWVADVADGAPLGSVVVSIDGTVAGPATTRIARPDVASHFNNTAYANSGYQFVGNASVLTVGSHQVTVTARDSAGRATTFGPLTINVTN